MAEVIELPPTLEREWRAVEAGLRRMVAAVPHDVEELEHCIARLKPTFVASSRTLAVPVERGNPEAAVQAINAWVQDLVEGLLIRLFVLELELYRLRGPSAAQHGRCTCGRAMSSAGGQS